MSSAIETPAKETQTSRKIVHVVRETPRYNPIGKKSTPKSTSRAPKGKLRQSRLFSTSADSSPKAPMPCPRLFFEDNDFMDLYEEEDVPNRSGSLNSLAEMFASKYISKTPSTSTSPPATPSSTSGESQDTEIEDQTPISS